MTQNSLEDIKVGDVVVVRYHQTRRTLARVAKVGKLHFFLENRGKTKFRKSDGVEVGEGVWSRERVARPAPGEIAAINAEIRARNARDFVQKHIDAIRDDPAAFIPIAEFIKSTTAAVINEDET